MMASFSYDGDWQAWFWRGSDSAASPGMEGGRNNPPGSFLSPSWSIGVQTQSKLANDFWKKKKTKHKKTKTKESYQKYDLVSPTPQEGIKARHHDQSWASEWVRREQLCRRLSSIRQVGGSSPPHTLNGAVVFHSFLKICSWFCRCVGRLSH